MCRTLEICSTILCTSTWTRWLLQQSYVGILYIKAWKSSTAIKEVLCFLPPVSTEKKCFLPPWIGAACGTVISDITTLLHKCHPVLLPWNHMYSCCIKRKYNKWSDIMSHPHQTNAVKSPIKTWGFFYSYTPSPSDCNLWVGGTQRSTLGSRKWHRNMMPSSVECCFMIILYVAHCLVLPTGGYDDILHIRLI